MPALYYFCPGCKRYVGVAGFRSAIGCCKACAPAALGNRREPHTDRRTLYLRSLSVPELRAYVQGQLQARESADDPTGELRLIADRLEWVATSLIVAGIDGWQATYGGLRAIRPPRPAPVE